MKAKIVLAAMISFALAACAAYTAVDPSKPVTLSNGVIVEPQVPWATSSSGFAGTVWTIDGLRLNSLRFLTGITPGNPVMTIPGINKKDMITYNATMLPNDVIDMVPVRRTLVTAVRTMRVLAVMFAAFVLGRAFGGIHLIDRNGMLIDVSLV